MKLKRFYLLISSLLVFSYYDFVYAENNNGHMIEAAFVTFATANYFPLLEVLIKSVHEFSTRPIIAYGINSDIPFSVEKYPQLIKRRIDDLQYGAMPLIYYQKFNTILKSNIKYGVYVEADDIVNYAVDDLFEYCKTIEKYP